MPPYRTKPRRRSIVVLSLGVLVLAIAAPARAGPAPSGLPNLLCRKPTFPGRAKQTTAGIFSYRPRNCSMEIFEKSPGFEQSSHLLAVRWLRWDGSSAYGLGHVPLTKVSPDGDEQAGRERVMITLSRPVKRCGRLVFSRAHVRWFFAVTIDYPYRLHEVAVVGRDCPQDE
jgi:hypothetical protein